jgi:hypothetical protein
LACDAGLTGQMSMDAAPVVLQPVATAALAGTAVTSGPGHRTHLISPRRFLNEHPVRPVKQEDHGSRRDAGTQSIKNSPRFLISAPGRLGARNYWTFGWRSADEVRDTTLGRTRRVPRSPSLRRGQDARATVGGCPQGDCCTAAPARRGGEIPVGEKGFSGKENKDENGLAVLVLC